MSKTAFVITVNLNLNKGINSRLTGASEIDDIDTVLVNAAVESLRSRWTRGRIKRRMEEQIVSDANDYEYYHPASVTFDPFKNGLNTEQWSARVTYAKKMSSKDNMIMKITMRNRQKPFTYTEVFTNKDGSTSTYTCTVGNIARRRLGSDIGKFHVPINTYMHSVYGEMPIRFLRFYSKYKEMIIYKSYARTTGNSDYRSDLIDIALNNITYWLRNNE